MNLKFKALEVPKESAIYDINHLGWSTIETVVFNYDGKGTVLAMKDGQLEEMTLEEFRDVLFGGWYERVNEPRHQGRIDDLGPRQLREAELGFKPLIALSMPQVKMLYNLLVEKGHSDLVGYRDVKELFLKLLKD